MKIKTVILIFAWLISWSVVAYVWNLGENKTVTDIIIASVLFVSWLKWVFIWKRKELETSNWFIKGINKKTF